MEDCIRNTNSALNELKRKRMELDEEIDVTTKKLHSFQQIEFSPMEKALFVFIASHDIRELILMYCNVSYCSVHFIPIPWCHDKKDFKCLLCDIQRFPAHHYYFSEPITIEFNQIISLGWRDKELQRHIVDFVRVYNPNILMFPSNGYQDYISVYKCRMLDTYELTFRIFGIDDMRFKPVLHPAFFI